MKTICMIPGKLGSLRLPNKNLCLFDGKPLIEIAIQKAKQAECFTEIWLSSADDGLKYYADIHNIGWHKRTLCDSSNTYNQNDFFYDFAVAHPCDWLFMRHCTSPLITIDTNKRFVDFCLDSSYDSVATARKCVLECLFFENNIPQPINFSFDAKIASQNLKQVYQYTWGLAGHKYDVFMNACAKGKCGTFSGKIGIFILNDFAETIAIKTQQDLDVANALNDCQKMKRALSSVDYPHRPTKFGYNYE